MPPNNDFPAKACQDYTDAELIAMLLAGGPAAERALDCLYKLYFDQARKSFQRHRLERETILDAYANALMALRDQVLAGKFRAQGPMKAFFAKIFKFKCIDEFRRATTNRKEDPELRKALEEEMATLTPEERLTMEEEQNARTKTDQRRSDCMDKAMAPFSERDRKMLDDYHIQEMPLAEVAEKYGFGTRESASSVLSKLKKELIKNIESLCQNDPNCQLLCPGSRQPNQAQ